MPTRPGVPGRPSKTVSCGTLSYTNRAIPRSAVELGERQTGLRGSRLDPRAGRARAPFPRAARHREGADFDGEEVVIAWGEVSSRGGPPARGSHGSPAPRTGQPARRQRFAPRRRARSVSICWGKGVPPRAVIGV
jgi:hypothetical protein